MVINTFIVRPFREKKGIDFDRVERELFGPALDAHGIADRTTLDILAAGNIRTDMFRKLLTADLVIADVSIHNANVFYELGIRHALRRQHPILTRGSGGDDFPFDLFTDRNLSYDSANPAASVEMLTKTITHTLLSKVTDSPVFLLVPNLPEPDADAFLTVPSGFTEAVEFAKRGMPGEEVATKLGDLGLLADDITGLSWESNGLRRIGRAQFDLDAGAAATTTWERIRNRDENDIEPITCWPPPTGQHRRIGSSHQARAFGWLHVRARAIGSAGIARSQRQESLADSLVGHRRRRGARTGRTEFRRTAG